MTIQFCGAAREVTGSCHLITLNNGFKILLDCGLYQGFDEAMEDFNKKWLFNPREVDCLIVSHAHIDHTGRIPKLVADGFSGPIYATMATRDLCGLMLLDSAKIQEMDAGYKNKKKQETEQEEQPLYTLKDVQRTMNLFVGHNYDQWFSISPDVRVLYRDAGHILGSASVTLEITENGKKTRFGFTGDIGRPARPILNDPMPMPEVDYLICESTYGDREHESAPNEVETFARIVEDAIIRKRGKLIIPAFSVGRTQEVVYLLDQLENAGRLPRIPVFVDSPLAINATEVFANHPECFDADIHKYMVEDPNPFGFNGLRYIRDVEGSKALNSMEQPGIIIAASGMMNAGRVKHHLFNNVENPKNTFLIVGYCAPGTPGAALRDGEPTVRVFGKELQIKAEVQVMDSFSAHGDRTEMLDMLSNQKNSAKNIWLVHGSLDRQEKWRQYLLDHGFKKVDIPSLGETAVLE